MASIEKKENFNCTAEQLFAVLADYESYPDFLSDIKAIEITKTTKTYKLVKYTVLVIKNISYELRLKEVKNKSISWDLESGLLFKTLSGSWKLSNSKTKKGTTDVLYSADLSLRVFAPKIIEKTLVEVNLKNMMSSFKKRIKKLYH